MSKTIWQTWVLLPTVSRMQNGCLEYYPKQMKYCFEPKIIMYSVGYVYNLGLLFSKVSRSVWLAETPVGCLAAK